VNVPGYSFLPTTGSVNKTVARALHATARRHEWHYLRRKPLPEWDLRAGFLPPLGLDSRILPLKPYVSSIIHQQ
jgi:hypothetical protein